MKRQIAVIVKGWPRLSETFIAQELIALERAGLELTIVSLRHPHDNKVHQWYRDLQAEIIYLPEYLHREPLRVWRGVRRAYRMAGWRQGVRVWLCDLLRNPSRNRIRRWGQACVLAAEMPTSVGWIYSHFLHTPSSVARYASLLTDRGWSFSAHAKDIWTTPTWEKRNKLSSAGWGTVCHRRGWEHLNELTETPNRLHLIYHGLDFDRFPSPGEHSDRDGHNPREPVRLLSVGRAVAKKGFPDLLRALADLPPNLTWHWIHIGGGGQARRLKRLARRLGLQDRVSWLGGQDQDRVIEYYRWADVFILPCRRSRSGDQDGLPNVLLEALLLERACISTTLVDELITHDNNGLLVAPRDISALRLALIETITNPQLRQRLGQAGRLRVLNHFGSAEGTSRIADLLRTSLATSESSIFTLETPHHQGAQS